MTTIVGITGGAEAGGRTATAVAAILGGAAEQEAKTELLGVCERATDELVTAVEAADAVVLGEPGLPGDVQLVAQAPARGVINS